MTEFNKPVCLVIHAQAEGLINEKHHAFIS